MLGSNVEHGGARTQPDYYASPLNPHDVGSDAEIDAVFGTAFFMLKNRVQELELINQMSPEKEQCVHTQPLSPFQFDVVFLRISKFRFRNSLFPHL